MFICYCLEIRFSCHRSLQSLIKTIYKPIISEAGAGRSQIWGKPRASSPASRQPGLHNKVFLFQYIISIISALELLLAAYEAIFSHRC